MAVSRTLACLGCFLVIISSQWMTSFSDEEAQQESTNTPSADESKPVWGPWIRNVPQPQPSRKPWPDKNGGSSRGGVGVVGGGGIGGIGGRGRGIGGGGGRRGSECICNCKCDCQNSRCNGGSGGSGGGGGAGYGNGKIGGAGGGGGGGGGHGGYSGLTICMPLPPGMELEMSNYHFSAPSLGERGGPNAHTEGMNATATNSKHQ